MSVTIYALLNALFLAILLSFSHGLLKWVSTHGGEGHWQAIARHWWVLGGAMSVYVFIFFYYTYVLRQVSLNILYPVYTGLSIVLVFAMGVVMFKEPYSWQNVAGCILIIAGIFLVSGTRG